MKHTPRSVEEERGGGEIKSQVSVHYLHTSLKISMVTTRELAYMMMMTRDLFLSTARNPNRSLLSTHHHHISEQKTKGVVTIEHEGN